MLTTLIFFSILFGSSLLIRFIGKRISFHQQYHYERVYNGFLENYELYTTQELYDWKYLLEDDIAFRDKNPYNRKMLNLIDDQIIKMDLKAGDVYEA